MKKTLPAALGIDTGGTFTDFVLIQADKLQTHKVLSTPAAPEQAILQGINELGLASAIAAGDVALIHGSTVATNAALERKGVRTAFITTRGFKDMLTIGRQTRPALYQLETPPQIPPVEESLCFEVGGRIAADGQEIEELASDDLQSLLKQLEDARPEAIAINLLFSFLNEDHEQQVREFLLEHLSWQPFICCSHEVLPEYKEYERGIACWLNASLGPLVKNYLLALQAETQPSPLSIMQSSGGTIAADQAADKAANLLLSGPAGGLAAASNLSTTLGISGLMTFDMGGTSTDAALLEEGRIQLTSEGRIGSYPVGVPMVDMHTIGAGGGSIAYLDEGGLLHVGPESAGARPGPACYGLGGEQATVTDANLVLGRLQAEAFMGGDIELDYSAAQKAVGNIAKKLALTIEEASEGIISIANSHMSQALRAISVEKGYDPTLFRLCCFGGAGGLHICALADSLGMQQAIVPQHAGVLSALGMLVAPVKRNYSHSYQCLADKADETIIRDLFQGLKQQTLAELELEQVTAADASLEFSVDLRYAGQSSSLNLAWHGIKQTCLDFHALHEKRFGHALQADPELVNLRISVKAKKHEYSLEELPEKEPVEPVRELELHGFTEKVRIYQREQLVSQQKIAGPALVLEKNATTLIGTEWYARTDQFGHLFLDKMQA